MNDRPNAPVTPGGVNHIVLNTRDIEKTHRFWTEIIGFKQVGEIAGNPKFPDLKMRFYSGVRNGQMHHHDIAFMEVADLAVDDKGQPLAPAAVNHIAVTLPDRESWLQQLAFLQGKGVKFRSRVNHGMTHSVYITDPNGYGVELLYDLPREIWEGDVNGALNYVETLPTEGEEALADNIEDLPVFAAD